MSRYNNVVTLLDMAENYNHEVLIELLLDEDTDTETLAEDIAFVLISLWGMVPEYRQTEFKNRLTDEIVNVEIKEMFGDA
ncbi:MAG: hypothetical protein ABWY25_11735 [Paenisporosarcina sp.]